MLALDMLTKRASLAMRIHLSQAVSRPQLIVWRPVYWHCQLPGCVIFSAGLPQAARPTCLAAYLTMCCLQIARLPTFFKHRDDGLFPPWALVISTTIMRLPASLLEATVFTAITYFAAPLSLDAGRCGCRGLKILISSSSAGLLWLHSSGL